MLYAVPYFMGQPVKGLDLPAESKALHPDLPKDSEMERMAALYAALADAVAAATEMPRIYAGDCCVILGVLAGLQRCHIDPVLVFFDAHGDFNTWETTPSRFIGGMPLAMATGRGDQTIVEACGMRTIPDGDAILVDGRDLDPEEAELLARSQVPIVRVEDVVEALPASRPLYVHIDVDVVDPVELPAVSYPAEGGPSVGRVVSAASGLANTGRVAAFSTTVWNPSLPGAEESAVATHRMAAAFIS